MNDIFSFRRFAWLMRKTIMERPAQLLGIMLLSFTITFIIYGLTRLLQGLGDAQNYSFLAGLAIGGCFLASVVFGYFNNNASGASFLTLPASLLEKWLSGILLTGVIYVLLFLGFFRLMDLAFVAQYHHSLDVHSAYYQEQYEAAHILSFTEFVAGTSFMTFFNCAGIMLVGSLFFNKAAFIKTTLIICIVGVGAFLFNYWVVSMLIKNTQVAFPFTIVWIWVGKDRAMLVLPPESADMIKNIFRFALPAVFWSLSLLRLREKEF